MKTKSLGDRMKNYENVFRNQLPARLPVIIRLDGCHFHTYTRKMDKPFDERLAQVFWETSKYLASQIQGCKLVYHQSDEISILLTNYDKLTTESWFDNNISKMISVSASLASAKFNMEAKRHFGIEIVDQTFAAFDSRVFVLPHDEVANYFVWRQQDATKNSISMLAQAHFSPKELHKLNGSQKQDKLMLEKGINWNDIPTWQKRGACVIKREVTSVDITPVYQVGAETVVKPIFKPRMKWDIDLDIPIFTKDREYIEQFVYLKQED